MPRLQQPLTVSVAAHETRFVADHGGVTNSWELIVRVRGDELKARWPANPQRNSPPAFRGRIEQRADGTGDLAVTGVIRESFGDGLWSRAYRALTVFMVLLAIFGLVTLILGYANGGLPPLLIGILGALAFGFLWRRMRAARRPNFERQAADLEAGLRTYLATGDGRRAAF